jgi:hypothetical protein
MTCRQIWQGPLVDDGQSTDLTKLKKNTFDRQESVALKPVFLFAANFSPQKRKKVPCYLYRVFLFEKMIPSRHISKKKV